MSLLLLLDSAGCLMLQRSTSRSKSVPSAHPCPGADQHRTASSLPLQRGATDLR